MTAQGHGSIGFRGFSVIEIRYDMIISIGLNIIRPKVNSEIASMKT